MAPTLGGGSDKFAEPTSPGRRIDTVRALRTPCQWCYPQPLWMSVDWLWGMPTILCRSWSLDCGKVVGILLICALARGYSDHRVWMEKSSACHQGVSAAGAVRLTKGLGAGNAAQSDPPVDKGSSAWWGSSSAALWSTQDDDVAGCLARSEHYNPRGGGVPPDNTIPQHQFRFSYRFSQRTARSVAHRATPGKSIFVGRLVLRKVIPLAVAGGVLLSSGGVFGAAQAMAKDVELTQDGVPTQVRTWDGTVGQVLAKQGVRLGEHDVVAPALDQKVEDGQQILVRYGLEVRLTVDGQPETLWTTSLTLDEALAEHSIRDESTMSTSRSTPIGRQGLSVDIETAKNLTLKVDDQTHEVVTPAETVGDVLKGANVLGAPDNQVDPGVDAPVVEGMTIKVNKAEAPKPEPVNEGPKADARPSNAQAPAAKPAGDLSPAQGASCIASNYSDPQPTASGEQFNPSAMTAAHKTLPLGSKVKVTNPKNGKTVIVRINDRGPYIAGRCLDLSTASFAAIGDLGSGVMTVNYEVL